MICFWMNRIKSATRQNSSLGTVNRECLSKHMTIFVPAVSRTHTVSDSLDSGKNCHGASA